jgi:hypothetical protein
MTEYKDNPSAKKMCSFCGLKDDCDQTIHDQIFCKIDKVAWELKQVRTGGDQK